MIEYCKNCGRELVRLRKGVYRHRSQKGTYCFGLEVKCNYKTPFHGVCTEKKGHVGIHLMSKRLYG